jgi:catechol 2,3-dioxygenase-like lactoylglutathione lyase family enzyme
MAVEVIGIDHIYITVSDMKVSGTFYDRLMIDVLGYRKSTSVIAGDEHIHYYNRHFGFSLRPAKIVQAHDPYAPGLHHFCFRVEDNAAVNEVAAHLERLGIEATKPDFWPYDEDYYATFFEDPDGVRLEVTNFREARRARMHHWSVDIGS